MFLAVSAGSYATLMLIDGQLADFHVSAAVWAAALLGATVFAWRACVFTAARDMVTDDGRSAGFLNEVTPANGSGPAERARRKDIDSALDGKLVADGWAQLSAQHRAVLRRSYYFGSSTAQIAEDLGIPEATVKSRLHYGLHSLRQSLQKIGVGE